MKAFIFLGSAIVALVIVLSTFSIPQTTYNDADQSNVECGWPVKYVKVDVSRYSPPFPWEHDCSQYFNKWEIPSELYGSFWLAVLIIFIALVVLISKFTKAALFLPLLFLGSGVFAWINTDQIHARNKVMTSVEATELLRQKYPHMTEVVQTREIFHPTYRHLHGWNLQFQSQCFSVYYANDLEQVQSSECK